MNANTNEKAPKKKRPVVEQKAPEITPEEVHGDPGPALPIQSAEQKATQEVARYDVADAWIAAKKEEYSTLIIAGIDDREGEKRVKAAWQEIRNKRLAVAGKHKELKADYLTITRAIDNRKNVLTESLEEIEVPLKAMLDNVEAERENIRQAAEQERQKKLHARVAELLEKGMKYNGTYYAIGDTISMDVVTLKDFSDEKYSEFLTRVEAENNKILEAEQKRLDEEKQRQEDERKQREENEKENKRLAEEKENLKREVAQMRVEFLENLGFSLEDGQYQFRTDNFQTKLPATDLGTITPAQWDDIKATARANKGTVESQQAKYNREEAEREAKNKLFVSRLQAMADLKVYQSGSVLFYVSPDKVQVKVSDVDQLTGMDAETFDTFKHNLGVTQHDELKAWEEKQEAENKRKIRAAVHRNNMEHYGFTLKGNSNVYVRYSQYDETMNFSVSVADVENADEDTWQVIMSTVTDWVNELEIFEADKEKEEEARKESERVAALSDVEKMQEWLRKFAALMAEKPTVTSQAVTAACDLFDTNVSGHVSAFIDTLDDIEVNC